MMQNTFIRRLIYYLFGFGIGLILVFFVVGNRGCSWLPENKVKDSVKKRFVVSQTSLINSSNFNTLIENCEVEFDKSTKNSPNKTYLFRVNDDKNDKIKSFYISYNSDSYLAIIHINKDEITKMNVDSFLKIIYVPENESSLINFDQALGLKNELQKNKLWQNNYANTLRKNGFISYNSLKPNNDEAIFLLIDKKDSIKTFFHWKDLTLVPFKLSKND